MRTIAIVALLSLNFTCSLAPERVPSFSNLGKEDVIDVRYSSTSEYSKSDYEFSFSGGSTSSVAVVRLTRDPAGLAKTNRSMLATLSLTTSDLDGLDKLIGIYRSDRSRGGCTPVDTVTRADRSTLWACPVDIIAITHRRAGRPVATERFKIAICVPPKVKGVRTFHALVERAEGYK